MGANSFHVHPMFSFEWDRSLSLIHNPTDANGSRNANRGSGPWRGGTPKSRLGTGTPLRGRDSSRRGDLTPRGMGAGRGRGRGRGGRSEGRGRGRELDNGGDPFSAQRGRPHFGDVGVGVKARTMIGKDAPLSDLLYSERPLLRPVKFVRATLTPFLFQKSEDALKPASTSQSAGE